MKATLAAGYFWSGSQPTAPTPPSSNGHASHGPAFRMMVCEALPQKNASMRVL
jgi:hypothetical protein